VLLIKSTSICSLIRCLHRTCSKKVRCQPANTYLLIKADILTAERSAGRTTGHDHSNASIRNDASEAAPHLLHFRALHLTVPELCLEMTFDTEVPAQLIHLSVGLQESDSLLDTAGPVAIRYTCKLLLLDLHNSSSPFQGLQQQNEQSPLTSIPHITSRRTTLPS